MKITKSEYGLILSAGITCPNDNESNLHHKPTFDQLSDNKYKCSHCGSVLVIGEPALVHDRNWRLKMEVFIREVEK